MAQPKDPKSFLVVLPGEIIEIPQDSDKSWLTLFYSLPKELAEKWKPAFKATPQNTQKERPCGKIPAGRAYIRHSISAAAALI